MEKTNISLCNNKTWLISLICFILIIIISFVYFHYEVQNEASRHFEQNFNLLNQLENQISNTKQKNIIKQTAEGVKTEYHNFLVKYYEIQNNWLNYWLTITGMLMTAMAIVIPYIFAKRWQDEKEEFQKLLTECAKRSEELADKILNLDINQNKKDLEKMLQDKQATFFEELNVATDEMWNSINEKKEEMLNSIKVTIIEDILKNGPDTDYFMDKIEDRLHDRIDQMLDEKLQGDSVNDEY
jgi:hypothetical protein